MAWLGFLRRKPSPEDKKTKAASNKVKTCKYCLIDGVMIIGSPLSIKIELGYQLGAFIYAINQLNPIDY